MKSVTNACRLRGGVKVGMPLGVVFFAGTAWAEYIVPIAAHSPQALITLTTERDPDDFVFTITNKSTVGSSTLPLGGPAHVEVVTYDTGAPVHLLSREAFDAFNLAGANKTGANITPVNGVDAIASDPLGIYAGGFGAVTATSPDLAADFSSFRGQTNASVLYAPAGTELPSVVGTPLSSQYTSVIDYGNPQILNANGQEFRSPALSLHEFGSLPDTPRQLQLSVSSSELGTTPGFLPNLGNPNIDDFGDDPFTPTIGGSFFLDANLENDGQTRGGLELILDTGSQGTFVSPQVAATLGFDVSTDEPDFVVRLQTVSGTSDEVPGFIADTFTLPGIGGGLTLTDVPLVVFNLPDPRSPGNVLDGLVGMNLFADRVVTLDPEPATTLGAPGPYLGLSDQTLDNRDWVSTSGLADFNAASSWTGNGTAQLDWIAHVENNAGIDQWASVTADAEVSALNVVGDTERMTVWVQDAVVLTVFGTAIVADNGVLDLRNASISTLGVEIRSGGTLAGRGTVTGEVLSLGTIDPYRSRPGAVDGAGVLTFEGNIDLLTQNVLQIDITGTDNAGEFPEFDQLVGAQTITVDGTLDLALGFTPTAGDTLDIITADVLGGRFDTVTGLVNGDTMWTLDYGPSALTLEALLAGDLNGDGFVSQADLDLVLLNWGDTVTAGVAGLGDATGDGFIAQGDLDLVLLNWGNGTPPNLSAIPEPATAALLALSGLILTRRHPR